MTLLATIAAARNPSRADWWDQPAPVGAQDLASRFESLGDNCELAAFQRGVGVDQLAFFRWSSTSIPMLVRALDEDLAAGVDRAALRLEIAREREGGPGEYIVINDRYGTQAHAFAREGELEAELLIAREWKRLTLLRRKFLEDVAAGRRIYVYRSDQPVARSDARALLQALRRKGPNTLLWVKLAEDRRAAGTVELSEPGLAIGYIDQLAPIGNGADVRSQLWPLVLGRAYRLLRYPARQRAHQFLAEAGLAWTR